MTIRRVVAPDHVVPVMTIRRVVAPHHVEPTVRAPLAVIAAITVTAALAIGALIGCGAGAPRVASPSLADDAIPGDTESELESENSADLPAVDDHPAPGAVDDPRTDDRRTDRHAGPPIATVVRAAYAAAGLRGAVPGQIAVRARLGGLVPWVSVRTGRDASWHDQDPDVGRGTTLEVRATWRLDRLVFDGRELQVVALEAARRRERRRLATHVIRTYFTWKRSGSRSRADEAAAELDALTSGWFSETAQRAASELRTAGSPAATP